MLQLKKHHTAISQISAEICRHESCRELQLSLFWDAGACNRHSGPVFFRSTMREIALAGPVSHYVLSLTGIVSGSLFACFGCHSSVVIVRVLFSFLFDWG